MSEEPLPVAVIGVGGFGGQMLHALSRLGAARVVGLSDRDPSAAERAGRQFGVAAYADNRSLLAETRPRAVFLATPPMAAVDLISACAERGIHVWKECPLARDLDEGLTVVRRMDGAGLKLAVGTQRRFAPGYRQARQLRHEIGQPFLARAHYIFNWGPQLGWRGDRASAGGGAMLEIGYHPIDLLVWLLGLPETVYGLTAGSTRGEETDGAGAPLAVYDTDDTAVAALRYGGGLMGMVVTSRRSGPVSEELSLHGRAGSIVANAETCLLRDTDGNVLDRSETDAPPLDVFVRQAEAFVKAVTTGAKFHPCSGRENLLNLAVIDAVYLSNRTGQPENPRHLLQTRDLTIDYCLACRPVE